MSNLTVSCLPEYQSYVYNSKHDIWAIVSLKAPSQEEDEATAKRVAMDIVAVIDKSGSMEGEKMDLVKRTLEFVLTQLNEKDRLALITYDTGVYVDFSLMNMTSGNKETALDKIKSIRSGTCTNLSGGLMKGLDQISKRLDEDKNDIASVLLFTDGLANQGIVKTDGIVDAIKKRFAAPKPEPRQGERRSTRIKDTASQKRSGGDLENSSGGKRARVGSIANATVYTFGFGADHNADMLKKISDAGSGMYYFVETEDKISESFAHCLGGLMSTVAQGIQLKITMEPGVSIREVHSARPSERSGNLIVNVNVGDMQSEECRDIVLEMTINCVGETDCEKPHVLFRTDVNYFNVISNSPESISGSLEVLRPANEVSQVYSNVNLKVTKQRCRVSMTKAMKEADTKATSGNYEDAKQKLTEVIILITRCRLCLLEFYSELELTELDSMIKDLEECRTNIQSATLWKTKGKCYQTNMLQQYQCQRSSNSTGRQYQTKRKGYVVKQSKSFSKKK